MKKSWKAGLNFLIFTINSFHSRDSVCFPMAFLKDSNNATVSRPLPIGKVSDTAVGSSTFKTESNNINSLNFETFSYIIVLSILKV